MNLKIEEILIQAQIRKTFDQTAHLEMVESIKMHGILQPLLVRKNGDEHYILVAGERRIRAAKDAGLTEVPVHVVFGQAEQHSEMQIVENLQRADLSLEETAAGIDALYKRFGKMSDVCKAVSKSMPWVSKMVAVANKLGKYATELLAGGFTQDVELLTVLTRAEALENSWPRVELLTEEIKKKKAGRAEVIALYDELQAELAESTDETAPDDGGSGSEVLVDPVAELDVIHTDIAQYARGAVESWKSDDATKRYGPHGVKLAMYQRINAYERALWKLLLDANPELTPPTAEEIKAMEGVQADKKSKRK